MIKNVFVPERTGTYYIFPKRIVGFDLTTTQIKATQIYVSGNNVIIERSFDQSIEAGSPASYNERATAALDNVAKKIKKSDSIATSISSTHAIFKTLRLPFIGHEKIKMVIDFEVEPLLPFSLDDAVIDFIITHENIEEKSSEVLVVAVQKQYISQQMQLFGAIGITPEKILVDQICLYALYKRIPRYAHLKGGIVLLDVCSHDTQLAYIYDGRLKLIRTISQGVFDLAKKLGQKIHIPAREAMEQILRFGLEKSDDKQYNKALTESLQLFWSTITFTLNSFTVQAAEQQTIDTILMLGVGSEIKGLTNYVTESLSIKCELFEVNDLITDKNISSKNKALSRTNIISLATALPSPITNHFNLCQKEFKPIHKTMFNKQFISFLILTGALIGSLISFSYLQMRKFKREVNRSSTEVIDILKETFINKIDPSTLNIANPMRRVEESAEEAERAVEEEERQWSAFSAPARASFLKYLLELSTKLDKEGLGLSIDKISVTQDTLTLKGKVKGGREDKEAFDALAVLKKDLQQSKLFSNITGLKKPSFTAEVTLKQNGEE